MASAQPLAAPAVRTLPDPLDAGPGDAVLPPGRSTRPGPLFTERTGEHQPITAALASLASIGGIACLNTANVLLIRRTWQAGRAAAALRVPYAARTAFAAMINAKASG